MEVQLLATEAQRMAPLSEGLIGHAQCGFVESAGAIQVTDGEDEVIKGENAQG
jgi:hypothetical protein